MFGGLSGKIVQIEIVIAEEEGLPAVIPWWAWPKPNQSRFALFVDSRQIAEPSFRFCRLPNKNPASAGL
jgi:hypothetical protein